MSVVDRLKRLFAAEKKADVVRDITIRGREGWDVEPTFSGELVTARAALSLSAVWSCVNLVAGTVATLPFMVYRDVSGVRKVDRAHPLYRLLHDSPNYDQTAVDFWEFMAASVELWGNAYARIERNGARITGLHPINPALVSVRRLQNGQIEYSWSDEGKSYVLRDTDILHVRGFGGNPLGGMSTLDFGRQAFGLARSVERAAGKTFANGLRPSGVMTFEEWLTPEQRAMTRDALAKELIGAENAGRPLILEGKTKWESLAIKPEDAQMLQSRSFNVEEICRFFGVPPHMIGHTEKTTSWGTGLEQQTLGFQKFTLRRRLKRIEQAVMKQLLTDTDRARGVTVEFNLEGLLRGDSASRSAFYAAMTGMGAMTINEVRALENLPPVEGGDVARMQMQNIPITESNNANQASKPGSSPQGA